MMNPEGIAPRARWTPDLMEWLRIEAAAASFNLAGVAAVEGLDDPEERRDSERFSEWIETGRAGEMEYLKRRDHAGVLVRSSVQIPMPWARSVVLLALNYNALGPRSIDAADAASGWIARYAWSGRETSESAMGEDLIPSDYHDDLLARLVKVQDRLTDRTACTSKCYVDTGPVVERSLAARAGVGWIGKNTCVLNERLGSWLLLGTIVTSIPIGSLKLEIAPDRCGTCTRCIDACPTDALVAPRQMDASRCIAYLTIEKKGAIPDEFRAGMGRQVFGCDICQDVCPWNRKAPTATATQTKTREELINPDLSTLATMDLAEFRRWFKGSPVERTKRHRLHRNVAIAMGNSGQTQFLPQLQAWSKGDDLTLAEAASWSIKRIQDGLTATDREEGAAT